MAFIDVHAHLDNEQFDKDIDAVIQNAIKADVKIIVSNGLNPESNRKVLELAKKYPVVKAALGMFPSDALKLSEQQIDEELEFIKKNKDKIVAIGEVGIDKHWVKDKDREQQELFERFISLSEKTKRPLIVHSRKAEEEVINILVSAKVKVVMHCFGGSMKLAKKAADSGFYFSIPASITNSLHFQQLVREVNINQLLTETDCPYQSPFKGKRNEPAFVVEAANKIAEMKKFEKKEVENNILMNYQTVFSR